MYPSTVTTGSAFLNLKRVHRLPAADARTLGGAVRRLLKQRQLPWKVAASTRYGHDSMAVANISANRQVTPEERYALAAVLRNIRVMPVGDGGGAASIVLEGTTSTVDYTENNAHYSNAEQRFLTEFERRTDLDFFTGCGFNQEDLRTWTDRMRDTVDDAYVAVTFAILRNGLKESNK